jgi:hypothetical protein
MIDVIRRHKKAAAAIALGMFFVGCLGWELSASLRGRMVAHFDVARGHYKQLGFGLPVAYRPEYARLLRERYGIEYRAVAGCVVSESLIAYVGAYNAVSTAAANRRFGHDVFRQCEEDARRNWEAEHAAALSADQSAR